MKTEYQTQFTAGEVTLGYIKKEQQLAYKIQSSQDCNKFLRTIFPLEKINHREYAYLLLLNRNSHVVGYYQLSAGGISGTMIDPKLVFQCALLANASAIILCHNHPSTNLTPSKADESITQKIKQAGKFMDISLLDHIIITDTSYYSFADEGML